MTESAVPLSASRTSTGRRWSLRHWIVTAAAAMVALAVIATGAMYLRMMYVPANLDTATTRLSEHGLYRASYVSRLDPIAINQIHTWTFHLATPDGRPITGAQITVDGGMPQHGHGLPTSPQVTRDLGNGDYRVEGMKFQMTGWWVVNFHVTSNGQSDTVQFNFILNE
jgi:hypothetical protein